MALERFIPKSPDPFIRNSQDFEVAKFGHLNTIIEYVNSYVVTDSLQLAGSGPITSTARYITDSLGNASAISISTIGVGIGIDTPTSLLDVVRYTTGSVNNAYQFRILNSADGQYPFSVILLEHNNRTGVGNQGGAAIVIKDGFANVSRAGIVFDYSNSGSFSSAGGNLRLSNDGQGNLFLSTAGVDALRIFKDQGVQIGGVGTNLSSIARLLVKGTGSTSATTSLLVQNSNALTNLQVTDDGQVSVINEGKFNVVRYGNTLLSTGQATSSLSTYNSVLTVTNNYIAFNTLGNYGWAFLQDLFQGYHPMIIQDATYKARETSALVELNSKTRGFLPPKMTTAQKNAISSPTAGLVVYDTDLNKLCVYTTAWQTITSV